MVIEIVDLPSLKAWWIFPISFLLTFQGLRSSDCWYIPILSPLPGLVNVNKKLGKDPQKSTMLLMGKLTINYAPIIINNWLVVQ